MISFAALQYGDFLKHVPFVIEIAEIVTVNLEEDLRDELRTISSQLSVNRSSSPLFE
jgi:hypothetical protein